MQRASNRVDRVVSYSHPYATQQALRRAGSNRVYVGNLDWQVSWQELKDYFSAAGRVSFADVPLDATGRSKGYGIVEYETVDDADRAIDMLNDTQIRGRMIHVREDREAEGKEGRILVVENLPDSYSWQELKDMFNEAGSKVAHADVIEKNGTRCGIVEFKTIHDASTALRNSSLIAVEDMLIRKPHFGEELKPENRRKVYVGQLAWSVAWQDLKDHFRSIGEVVRADVSMEPGSQRSNGYGFVEFASEDDADRAIRELNNTILRGRQIYVREYRD